MTKQNRLITGKSEKFHLLLAHGAGAGMDSAFMSLFAEKLSSYGVTVVRFEFPYMEVVRETGKKRPPDKMEKLVNRFLEVIEEYKHVDNLFIGGKSMGGRIASMILAGEQVEAATREKLAGAICLGYPFHPPGKADKLRVSHLEKIDKNVLIIQGANDAFGKQHEVESYSLSDKVDTLFIEGGNHDLKAAKKYGKSHEELISRAVELSFQFMQCS